MYIHLGQTIVVREKEIIGLFDLDHITYNGRAAAFVNNAEKAGRLVPCTDDLPRSAVVTDRAVYLSPFSTATLERRLESHSPEGANTPMEVTL